MKTKEDEHKVTSTWRRSYQHLFCIFAIAVSTFTLTSQFSLVSSGQNSSTVTDHKSEERPAVLLSRYTSSDLANKSQQLLNEKLENIEEANKEESIRFVLFLSDLKKYPAAVTLVQSLSESTKSTSMPPRVMMTQWVILPSRQREFLESLGAEVVNATVPEDLKEACRRIGKSWWSFEKMLLFRSELMQSDIVLYMNVDAVVRGDVIDCMSKEVINPFGPSRELDMAAVATSRSSFNAGVLLAR